MTLFISLHIIKILQIKWKVQGEVTFDVELYRHQEILNPSPSCKQARKSRLTFLAEYSFVVQIPTLADRARVCADTDAAMLAGVVFFARVGCVAANTLQETNVMSVKRTLVITRD